MKLHLEIDTRNPDDLWAGVELLSSFLDKATGADAPVAKPKSAKKEAPEATEPTEDAQAYTADDIRARVAELIKAGKRDDVKRILKEFNADSVAKLNEEDYGQFMAHTGML